LPRIRQKCTADRGKFLRCPTTLKVERYRKTVIAVCVAEQKCLAIFSDPVFRFAGSIIETYLDQIIRTY